MKETDHAHIIITQLEQDLDGVWLSQKQLAELFGRDVATVNKHLANALETAEINPSTDIRHLEIQVDNGKCYTVAHYGLNAIMALAYRVQGPLASQLRRWAGRTLAEKGAVLPISGGRFQFAPDEPAWAQSPMKELSFNGVTVRLDEEQQTVWLTLNQMAALFGRNKSVVSRHLKHAFERGELAESATVANLATVQMEGSRRIERQVEHYNLDAILSVAYRVNSEVGTHFRKWATEILRPVFLGTQPAQPQQDRERELWRAYHSAKTGAVQLAVLGALGLGPAQGTGRRAVAAGTVALPDAAGLWSLMESVWERLRPGGWLRPFQAAEPGFLVDPAALLADLVAAGAGSGWSVPSVKAVLRQLPGAQANRGQVRFAGRKVRPVAVPAHAVPAWLRSGATAAALTGYCPRRPAGTEEQRRARRGEEDLIRNTGKQELSLNTDH